MSKPQVFGQLSAEQQDEYTRLARLEHGPDLVNESVQRWNSYSKARQDAIIEEGNALYAEIADAMQDGLDATDDDVQALFERWRQHIRYFYEPTLDILRGLGETYALSPDFRANFEKVHPDLPEYLRDGIAYYVDELETRVLEAMLAEDEARVNRLSQ